MGDAGSKKKNGISLDCKESSEVHRSAWAQQNLRSGATNEPAIEALAREIAKAHQEGSQSNGIIEGAAGLVAGQARTLKAALEHRIGTRIPPDARILCWLVEFAAYLMNSLGSDGKAPLQRLHGRRDNTPIPEFGEKLLYMPAKPARGGECEPRFQPGVCVGMLYASSEAVVVTEPGQAVKTHAANVRKIPESERWDADRILTMRAVQWSPDGSDKAFDIQVGMERLAEVVPRSPREVLTESKVARTHLLRPDFERWSFSEGCPGCRHLRTGQGRQQAHSEACRRRIEIFPKGCG